MIGATGINLQFVPFSGGEQPEAEEFELLFSVQDSEIFALIEEPLNESAAHGHSAISIEDAGLAVPFIPRSGIEELKARDAEIDQLKVKLLECERQIQTVHEAGLTENRAFADAEFSKLKDQVSAVCGGMQQKIFDHIAIELGRILEPFLGNMLLARTLSGLESAMSELIGNGEAGVFNISGSRDCIDKLSDLFADNRFICRFNIVNSDDFTVEYDNHLISTRLGSWAEMLNTGASQ
jgi:hypothetical protein